MHRRVPGDALEGQGKGLDENLYYWLYEKKGVLFAMIRVRETRSMGSSVHSTSGYV